MPPRCACSKRDYSRSDCALADPESFNTTHQYVEANLAMKQQALEKIVPPKTKAQRFRPDDQLLRFLESL